MGHLGNALAFRLGWGQLWKDTWYIENKFYSELFYNFYKLRMYLIYFFYKFKFERFLFLYSHFELFQVNKVYGIKIFFYDGGVEDLYEDLILDFIDKTKALQKTYRYTTVRTTWKYYHGWVWLMIYSIFAKEKLQEWNWGFLSKFLLHRTFLIKMLI